MRRVGFVLKRKDGKAVDIARELATWLDGLGKEAYVAHEHRDLASSVRAVPEEELAEHCDLLVVLGGDGTLLHGASLVGRRRVPLLAVNLGRLGFLTAFDPSEARDALAKALARGLRMRARMRLRVTLKRDGGGEPVERLALNDAVISQGAMARLIEIDATLDGSRITIYRADGLIVCTPTGSTAYNVSAGGPILVPGQSAMVVTPICPHTLTNRPLVVPARSVLGLRLHGACKSAILTVDGQWAYPVQPGDVVEVSRAEVPLFLYQSEKTYFEILRQKLSWGERQGAGG